VVGFPSYSSSLNSFSIALAKEPSDPCPEEAYPCSFSVSELVFFDVRVLSVIPEVFPAVVGLCAVGVEDEDDATEVEEFFVEPPLP